MRKQILVAGLALVCFTAFAFNASAQEKKESVGQTISKTAKKVGNKTAEVAVKGTAKVADQTYKGKMAPDGSDVYINGKNKKYYINKKGAKIYLKESQIKTRPEKKN
ncbi:hypothetical protein [Pedobacter gandavensis]|uniref:hypothetical protein n=1 Tax=Pedobacter gandavensis TaxID=2679963 RepID=UPI00292E4E10|nr:hypothetical protein [Pedobacter gandavensis]